jgi:flagellar basal-body rod protein FlgB
VLNQIDDNINILHKALDGTWLRNKAINHNISNVNTPNYKRVDVNFQDKLKKAMKKEESKLVKTHDKHLPVSKEIKDFNPSIEVDKSYSYRFDNNNVNIDTESAELAKNTIMYNALIDQTAREFNRIKNVIIEGGK